MVAELDHDVDGPLLVVLFLADPDLARAADTVERPREFLPDAVHELHELGMPVVLRVIRIMLE